MIVKLAAEVDVGKLLGRHKWRDFMTIDFADLVMTKQLCTKKSAGAGARSTSPSNLWASKNLMSGPSVLCFSRTVTYSSASRRDHEFVSRLVSFSMFIPYSISVD